MTDRAGTTPEIIQDDDDPDNMNLPRGRYAMRGAAAEAVRARSAAEEALAASEAARARAQRDLVETTRRHAAARAEVDLARTRIGDLFADEEFFQREHHILQKATPWLDADGQRLRDDVFIAAMQLHRAFVDAAAMPLATAARHGRREAARLVLARGQPPVARGDGGTIGLRASTQVSTELSYSRNDVDLPLGSFVTDLVIGRREIAGLGRLESWRWDATVR